MARRKRKLTAAEKRARRKRREQFMTIFINGRQNADPIWLHQNEMWELVGDD
jgi:hypothetical protein